MCYCPDWWIFFFFYYWTAASSLYAKLTGAVYLTEIQAISVFHLTPCSIVLKEPIWCYGKTDTNIVCTAELKVLSHIRFTSVICINDSHVCLFVQLMHLQRRPVRTHWHVQAIPSVGWWGIWSDVSVTTSATTQTLWTLRSSLLSSSSTSLPCPRPSLLGGFWVKQCSRYVDVSVLSGLSYLQEFINL